MRGAVVRQIAVLGLATALATVCPPSPFSTARAATACPAELASATRLIVVTAETTTSFRAKLETFERTGATEPWTAHAPASAAVVGRNGLAWGHPFRERAADRQSIKAEGDGRTPAGLYRLGRPFGFEAQQLTDYMKLQAGETFCVDDPRSPQYNRIVSRKSVPAGTTGEDMRTFAVYRHGLLVDYPSDAKAKAGSCIFVHNWRSSAKGTAGCVAAPESVVADMQRWANSAEAWIAIFAKADADQLKDCLK